MFTYFNIRFGLHAPVSIWKKRTCAAALLVLSLGCGVVTLLVGMSRSLKWQQFYLVACLIQFAVEFMCLEVFYGTPNVMFGCLYQRIFYFTTALLMTDVWSVLDILLYSTGTLC